MRKKWTTAFAAMMLSATLAIPQTPLYVQAAQTVTEEATLYAAAANNSSAEKDSNADGVTDNGFGYSLTVTGTTTTARITSYSGTATALTVPLTIEVSTSASSGSGSGSTSTTTTYDVTEIAAAAFAGNAGLTSVTMQGGTTGSNNSSTTTSIGLLTIGERAFYGCPSLTTVTIPATVTFIGAQAFSDCPALTALNVTAGNRRYVSNDGVLYEYLGYSSGSTTTYNTYTLMQYPSGKVSSEYVAPTAIASRLTAIGQGAFAGAQGLTNITLPEAVETIGAEAFRNCSALTSITIPEKVKTVPSYAFSGCSALESVSFPAGVASIGDGAFQNCYALGTISLPEKLTTISNSTFYGCSKLSEVTIPYGVATIGASAFAYCTSLVKITIPATVTSIGANAFLGVNGLTIYCHSGSQAANYAANNKIGTVMTYTVRFLSDTGLQLSAQEVVYGASATAPVMPDRPGYKLTWSSSFKNVTSDLSVTATYKRVYTVTFKDVYRGKTTVKEVEYGANAKAPSWTMSGYTLKWDKSFSNVTGDLTVYASWKDPKTGFVIDKNTKKPAAVDSELKKGTVTYRVLSANVQNPKVCYVGNSNTEARTISIPKTVTINSVKYKVTQIGEGAFQSNQNLSTLTIGSNVVKIGTKAFYKCKKLDSVKINTKSLSSIGTKAFYGIKNNAVFSAYRSKLTSYQSKIKKSGINTTIKLKAIS